MTRNLRLAFGVASALAVALALAIGPLVAGYALAGVSLGFIAVLMGMRAARAIGDWRLDHPWKSRRARSLSESAAHEKRRAA